jgi:hypothetical protein
MYNLRTDHSKSLNQKTNPQRQQGPPYQKARPIKTDPQRQQGAPRSSSGFHSEDAIYHHGLSDLRSYTTSFF